MKILNQESRKAGKDFLQKITPLVFALWLLASSGSAFGSITRVQSTTASTGASTATSSVTLTFGSNFTVGNVVAIAVGTGTSNAIPVPTSTATINWTMYWLGGANSTPAWIVLCEIQAGSSNAITLTSTSTSAGSASCIIAAVGAEYSGVRYEFESALGATATSTSPASGAAATTTVANEVWLGAINTRNTNGGGSFYTSPTNSGAIVAQVCTSVNTANTDRAVMLWERIVSSTGTPNAGATAGSSGVWVALVTALKPAVTSVSRSRTQ